MPALLVLTPPPSPVTPGGEAVVVARIRNTGAVVDQFTLQVLGAAAQWSAVQPVETSLFPGADGEARIVLRVPLGPEVPAGPLPIGVMIRSAADGWSTVEETVITVLPAVVVNSRLVPRRSKGSSGAKHRLVLRNSGNVPAAIALNASDPDEALALRMSDRSITIPPGGKAEAGLRLRPKKRTWTGGAEPKEFTISVVPQGAEPQAVPGTFVQMPTVRGWMLMGVAAAIVILAVILVLGHNNGTPSTAAKNAGAAALAGNATPSATPGAATPSPAAATPSPGTAGPPTPATQPSPAPTPTGNHPTPTPPPPTPTPWPAPPASLFAVVNGSGGLIRGGGVSAVSKGGGSTYDVTFIQDISQCSWTAVPGDGGAGTSPPTAVEASVGSVNAHVVHVEVKNYGGGTGTSSGFDLSVLCDKATSDWAVVDYNGNPVRGTATGVAITGGLRYTVTFSRDVSHCAYIATNGDPGGMAYVYQPAVVLAAPGATPNSVDVEYHSTSGTGGLVDNPAYAPYGTHFALHLQVYCNPNTYFAYVVGTTGQGSHGANLGARKTAGTFDVNFDRDITACSLIATLGSNAHGGIPENQSLEISVTNNPLGGGGARVFVTNASSVPVDQPFYVVASC